MGERHSSLDRRYRCFRGVRLPPEVRVWFIVPLASLLLIGLPAATAFMPTPADWVHGRPARSAEARTTQPAAADPTLHLDINYAHDSVQGPYELGHTIYIKVTDGDGATVKGLARLTTDSIPELEGVPGFSTSLQGWIGEAPDIQPGDWIFGSVDGDYEDATYKAALRVGVITFTVDYAADLVSGVLTADWFTAPLVLHCEIPGQPIAPAIENLVDPNEGVISCDFGADSWDVTPPQAVEVIYWEPDGDRISNTFEWPHMLARMGPDSGGNRHLLGEHAGAGAVVQTTLTDSFGSVLAVVEMLADHRGAFDTGDALPEESLAFWNEIETDFGNGITDSLTLYPVAGNANPETDVVELSAAGEPDFSMALSYCTPTLQCDSIDLGAIGLSGIVTVDLMAERGFDIQLGASFRAFLTATNGHTVEYSWSLPAPELSVTNWRFNGHARPGGVVTYGVSYRNDGNGPAEGVTLIDTLPTQTLYFADTSGLAIDTNTPGIVSWNVGTLAPGQEQTFAVTLEVPPTTATGTGAIGENCLSIATTTAGDWNPGNDLACAPAVDVWEDTVDFEVAKWAVPGDPAPGQQFDYVVRWCNHQGTGAGPVNLTDTLPAGSSLVAWRADDSSQSLWLETEATAEQLILFAPGLPGDTCGEVFLRAQVAPETEIGSELFNLVELDVGGDVNPSDNFSGHALQIGIPRQDLGIAKGFAKGILVPGGWVDFEITYWNSGNIATTVAVTDTLPPGLVYLDAWWNTAQQGIGEPLPTPAIIGNELHWELPQLGVSYQASFRARFHIDTTAVPGTEAQNCVMIAGEVIDSHPGNNSVCSPYSLFTSGPNLGATKWHEWLSDLRLGYTVRFENRGDAPVFDVVLRDTLPVGTTSDGWWDVDADWRSRLAGDPVNESGVITWVFNRVDPGEAGYLQFHAQLDELPQPLQQFTNTVEITLPFGDPDAGDNFSSDVAFSGNQCSGTEVTLIGEVYDQAFFCGAPESINAVAVRVSETGQVTFRAPVVVLGNGFKVEQGGSFRIDAW